MGVFVYTWATLLVGVLVQALTHTCPPATCTRKHVKTKRKPAYLKKLGKAVYAHYHTLTSPEERTHFIAELGALVELLKYPEKNTTGYGQNPIPTSNN